MADNYMETLQSRDRAVPLKKVRIAPGCDPIPACPNCGDWLILTKSDKFCRQCGQRLAIEDWAL